MLYTVATNLALNNKCWFGPPETSRNIWCNYEPCLFLLDYISAHQAHPWYKNIAIYLVSKLFQWRIVLGPPIQLLFLWGLLFKLLHFVLLEFVQWRLRMRKLIWNGFILSQISYCTIRPHAFSVKYVQRKYTILQYCCFVLFKTSNSWNI